MHKKASKYFFKIRDDSPPNFTTCGLFACRKRDGKGLEFEETCIRKSNSETLLGFQASSTGLSQVPLHLQDDVAVVVA